MGLGWGWFAAGIVDPANRWGRIVVVRNTWVVGSMLALGTDRSVADRFVTDQILGIGLGGPDSRLDIPPRSGSHLGLRNCRELGEDLGTASHRLSASTPGIGQDVLDSTYGSYLAKYTLLAHQTVEVHRMSLHQIHVFVQTPCMLVDSAHSTLGMIPLRYNPILCVPFPKDLHLLRRAVEWTAHAAE